MRRPILHVITRLEAGGAPNTLLLLLEGLVREGLPVELATGVTPPPASDLLPEAESLGIPVHVIPSLRRNFSPLHDLQALIGLRRLMSRSQPALVHTHTSKGGFLGRLAARQAGIAPRIYTPHGTVLTGYFPVPVQRFYECLERTAARWTDRIVGLNRLESHAYMEAGIGHPEQHMQIANGIRLEQFARPPDAERERMRNAAGLAPEELLMVTIGRLVPVKDQRTMLLGLHLLGGGLPPWRLWIVGDGPKRPDLESLVTDLAMTDRVAFLGQRDDVSELLGLSDLFLLTSLNEGFGLVLVEAMASRLPVVATKVGGVPEVVVDGKTGLLVPSSDPGALAEAVGRLLRDRGLRDSMGEAGEDRARACFGADRMVSETVALYRALLPASWWEEQ